MENFVIPGTFIAAKDDRCCPGDFTHLHDGKIFATVVGRLTKTKKPNDETVFSVEPLRHPCPTPVIGAIVLAKVSSLTRRFVRCDLVAVGERPLAGPYRGMILREDIRATQRDRAEPALSFRPGDLVRARIINYVGPAAGASTCLPTSGDPETSSFNPEVASVVKSVRAVAASVQSFESGGEGSSSNTTCLLSTAEPELGVVVGIGRPPLSGTADLFGSTGGVPLLPASWTEMVCPRTMVRFPRKVARVPDELLDILASSTLPQSSFTS